MLLILLVADLFIAGGGGYLIFCQHNRFYDDPFLFVVTIMSIMVYVKIQLYCIGMSLKEAYSDANQ